MTLRRGQVAVYLVAALVAVAVLMVMNVSLFLAVRAKNRAMNAGDAAALAVARRQGELLNEIGRLNVEHLKAALADDAEECARIMERQARLCFLGPLECIRIGNEAARANGVKRDGSGGMLRILREHVTDIRTKYAEAPDLYPEPWEGAWAEYADALESVVGTLGDGLVAGPDNVEFADSWRCVPLLSQQFYNAVAGRCWCWFHFNGEWMFDCDSHNMPRPDFASPAPNWNSEVYPLHLTFGPIERFDEEWRGIVMKLAGCTESDIAGSRLLTSESQRWAFFDGLWRTWSEMDPDGERRFPVVGRVKEEYDVRGCAAVCRVAEGFDDLVDGSEGLAAGWAAAAKPFGTVEGLGGGVEKVTALNGFVTPAFTDARLVPLDAVGGADLATADAAWMDHVRRHLPDYFTFGPVSNGGCWYCARLVEWENPVLRAEGRRWLSLYGETCTRPAGGGYAYGGTQHGH